jgi:MFS family permease
LTFPSSVSIISTSLESGQRRNIGFAVLGLSMPLGFSAGLVLGGVFVSGLGWRVGFYIGGAATFVLFAIGIWALPITSRTNQAAMKTRLASEVDWVGAGLASSSLALLSYVLT